MLKTGKCTQSPVGFYNKFMLGLGVKNSGSMVIVDCRILIAHEHLHIRPGLKFKIKAINPMDL